MRRRIGGSRRGPRLPKPLVSVKERSARKRGRCAGCRTHYEAGDIIVQARIRTRKFHPCCVPVDITTNFAGTTQVAAPPPPKILTAEEAALAALVSIETALVARAQQLGITDEMEKQFDRYQKLKAHVLKPGSPAEEKAFLRRTLLDAINLVF